MISKNEFAHLVGQPVAEVDRAISSGYSIDNLVVQNEADIQEAKQFRHVLAKLAESGQVRSCFYPGAGADLIPDEILAEKFKLPVYKTSHPDEYDEYTKMIPVSYREKYFPSTFESFPAEIPPCDMLILRNIPYSPLIFDSVLTLLSSEGGVIITFDSKYTEECQKRGFTDISYGFVEQAETKIKLFKRKT